MRRTISALALLAALAAPALAAEETAADLLNLKDVLRLDPVGPWNVDFADEKCRLSGLFGPPDTPYLLYLEQAAPRASFDIAFAGSQLSRFQHSVSIRLGLAKDAPSIEVGAVRETRFDSFGPGIFIPSVKLPVIGSEPESIAFQGRLNTEVAKGIERVVVARGGKAISFETGRLDAPFEVMNNCTDDLIRQWGFDPGQPRPEQSPDPVNILSVAKRIQKHYPPGAARKGESGMFVARLVVEADGSVSECHLDAKSITEALKPTACRELLKLHFKPALDSNGKPMRWFWTSSITYLLQ